MIDINDIAALLHVDEKLRAHGGRFPNMIRAVAAKLDEYEAQHTGSAEEEPEVEPEPTEPGETEDKTEDRRNI